MFGAAFVVQSIIFLEVAWRDQLSLAFRRTVRGYVGLSLIAYAALAYPVLGLVAGHHLTELPMFGVTPGPVTIFTFGCILLTTKPIPWRVLTIPLLWSFIGGAAALVLDLWQDWALPVSGVAVLFLLGKATRFPAPSAASSPSRLSP